MICAKITDLCLFFHKSYNCHLVNEIIPVSIALSDLTSLLFALTNITRNSKNVTTILKLFFMIFFIFWKINQRNQTKGSSFILQRCVATGFDGFWCQLCIISQGTQGDFFGLDPSFIYSCFISHIWEQEFYFLSHLDSQ